jgi:hypothetical protein
MQQEETSSTAKNVRAFHRAGCFLLLRKMQEQQSPQTVLKHMMMTNDGRNMKCTMWF